MRKESKITLGDRTIPVRELRVRDYWDLLNKFDGGADETGGMKAFAAKAGDLLAKCTDLAVDDLIDFTPSELRALWDEVKQVNADFFEAARAMGLMAAIEQIKAKALASLNLALIDSLPSDTDPPSGITAGAGSSGPSTD